jgi:hypothetical protein
LDPDLLFQFPSVGESMGNRLCLDDSLMVGGFLMTDSRLTTQDGRDLYELRARLVRLTTRLRDRGLPEDSLGRLDCAERKLCDVWREVVQSSR